MHQEIGFWLAVALVSIVSVAMFKIVAGKTGDKFPALADLAAFI